jgi:hydrogenase small subunit
MEVPNIMSMDNLVARGVSRRDFLKLCTAATAALGLSESFAPQMALATEKAMGKKAVIWLEGQDCAGCTESFAATINPSVAEIVLDTISLRYHETLMAGAGLVAEKALEDTIKEGGYVLVVEGSIPTTDDRACMIGGKSFKEILIKTAKNADAIIAFGSCATSGGINKTCPTESVGVDSIIKDKDKPIINLSSCPGKPTRLISTILYYLTTKEVPALDAYKRPLAFYSNLVHDNCPRRGHFENGEFLKDWNDPKQKEYCLLLKGCKGPKTYSDCPKVWWNDNTSWCINAGSPCSGCSQPEYYNEFSPLYEKQDTFRMPGIGNVNVDTLGKAIGGAAAVGVAAHFAVGLATGKLSKEQDVKDNKGVRK